MNKNCILIVSLLALSLSWVGCNKAGKLDKVSTFKPTDGPVEFKLKWPKGERLEMSMNMTQNMLITIPGLPNPMKQDMDMGQDYGFKVLDDTPDGGHEVEMDFLGIRMKSLMGGKTLMDYDSAQKPSADHPGAPNTDVFGKIVGAKIRFFLDASNTVERTEGVDELVNSISTGAKADQQAIFKSMYSEDHLKEMMSQYKFMPPTPVQVGDTWPVKSEVKTGMIGILVMDETFTFQDWEFHGKRNCARFDFQGAIKLKPDTEPNPMGMLVTMKDGDISGSTWFDPELGIAIDTTMNMDMNMTITVPQQGKQAAQGKTQTVTNQMTQVISVKLLSLK
jgi:hypothetical protein